MVPFYRRIVLCACLALGAVVLLGAPAGAGVRAPREGHRGIDVIQVNGLVDPANASLLRDSIRDANRRRATLLVLQVDSGGAVDVDTGALLRDVVRSRVPVAVWVGPSGATAKGAAALLLSGAAVASVSNGSSAGPVNPVRLDGTPDGSAGVVHLPPRDPSVDYPVPGRSSRPIAHQTLGAAAARRQLAVDRIDALVGELIVGLNGKTVMTASGPVELSTAKVVGTGKDRRLTPNQVVRFRRLGLAGQALHTLVSPTIAYLLFVVALLLITFEFFTASVGIAGFVGALALVGACIGWSHLPVHWWAAMLLVIGVLGFAVDIQAGGLGAWTFIGGASLIAGSVFLYGGSSNLDPAWWVLVLVIGGAVLFLMSGMTAMIRSRFSTPTVGREGMVGEMGTAEVDVAPDGVVRVREALWRARTNRATPIRAGQVIRVVSVEGLVLEVEPETGGAKDYRH
ncbi:MAG: NfeD family protein [Acidimicrobiia bacterium]